MPLVLLLLSVLQQSPSVDYLYTTGDTIHVYSAQRQSFSAVLPAIHSHYFLSARRYGSEILLTTLSGLGEGDYRLNIIRLRSDGIPPRILGTTLPDSPSPVTSNDSLVAVMGYDRIQIFSKGHLDSSIGQLPVRDLSSIAIAPNSDKVYFADRDNGIFVWDYSTGGVDTLQYSAFDDRKRAEYNWHRLTAGPVWLNPHEIAWGVDTSAIVLYNLSTRTTLTLAQGVRFVGRLIPFQSSVLGFVSLPRDTSVESALVRLHADSGTIDTLFVKTGWQCFDAAWQDANNVAFVAEPTSSTKRILGLVNLNSLQSTIVVDSDRGLGNLTIISDDLP